MTSKSLVFTVAGQGGRRNSVTALHSPESPYSPSGSPSLLAGRSRDLDGECSLCHLVAVRQARLRPGYCAAPVGEKSQLIRGRQWVINVVGVVGKNDDGEPRSKGRSIVFIDKENLLVTRLHPRFRQNRTRSCLASEMYTVSRCTPDQTLISKTNVAQSWKTCQTPDQTHEGSCRRT